MGDLLGYEAVLEALESCGDVRNAANARVSVGFARIELGDWERAERDLSRALADAEKLWLETVATRARQNLSLSALHRGDFAQARTLLDRVIAESLAQHNARFAAWSRIYVAMVALAAGDAATAEREAASAAEAFAETPPPRAGALAVLARARLVLGTDAASPAKEAFAILEQFGGIEEFESLVWLAAVEAGVATPAAAKARLVARAGAITDPAARTRFLAEVVENARIMETS